MNSLDNKISRPSNKIKHGREKRVGNQRTRSQRLSHQNDQRSRSRYQRCPKCKKVRMKWVPANWWYEGRTRWERLTLEGKKVCHICVERDRAYQKKRKEMKMAVASKTKHAEMWKLLRETGYPIISTWIDEAGPGETDDFEDLAKRCINDVITADLLLLYAEPGEILKGALIEAGACLGSDNYVVLAGECESLSSVFKEHPNWLSFPSLDEALKAVDFLLQTLPRVID